MRRSDESAEMRPAQQNSTTKPGAPRRQASRGLAKPGLIASSVFILLLTGPPKFRFRDPESSLYQELDLATVVNAVVWVAAGVWLLWQLREHFVGKRPPLRLTTTHKWALVVILVLAASIPVSLAPALSAFKVYQVCVLFGLGIIFVQRYGARICFERMLQGYLLLCALIALFFFASPDLVVLESETGALRLAGRGIAETGIVTSLAILVLGATRKRLLAAMPALACGLLGVLLFYSLMRTAYAVVAVFFAMLLWKRYPGKKLVGLALLLAVGVFVLIVAGMVPDLNAYRDPESIWTLSDRIGLWSHFLARTLEESPWLGLGFVSGTRIAGMEFRTELGTGHSIFFEAFVGGGILALTAFLILFLLMARDAVWLFYQSRDRLAFAGVALFMAVFLIGLIGGELDSGQIGFAFWMLVSLLPYLRERAIQEPPVRRRNFLDPRTDLSEQSA